MDGQSTPMETVWRSAPKTGPTTCVIGRPGSRAIPFRETSARLTMRGQPTGRPLSSTFTVVRVQFYGGFSRCAATVGYRRPTKIAKERGRRGENVRERRGKERKRERRAISPVGSPESDVIVLIEALERNSRSRSDIILDEIVRFEIVRESDAESRSRSAPLPLVPPLLFPHPAVSLAAFANTTALIQVHILWS